MRIHVQYLLENIGLCYINGRVPDCPVSMDQGEASSSSHGMQPGETLNSQLRYCAY